VHDLFEQGLRVPDFSTPTLTAHADALVAANLMQLYAADVTDAHARQVLHEAIPSMQTFAHDFLAQPDGVRTLSKGKGGLLRWLIWACLGAGAERGHGRPARTQGRAAGGSGDRDKAARPGRECVVAPVRPERKDGRLPGGHGACAALGSTAMSQMTEHTTLCSGAAG
jgi:hypothetical protein